MRFHEPWTQFRGKLILGLCQRGTTSGREGRFQTIVHFICSFDFFMSRHFITSISVLKNYNVIQGSTDQNRFKKIFKSLGSANKNLKISDRLGPVGPRTWRFADPWYYQNILKLKILTRTKKLEIRRFIIIEIM